MHELLDIVDHQDRIIGRATRAEIHRTQRLHRAVHMLVGDADGRVYLQKRAATKETNPNCWDSSAAGHVDSGEHYAAAAVRELSEELGIAHVIEDLERFCTRAPRADNGFEHQRFYRVRTSQTITPCELEIAEGGWFSLQEIDAWVASDDKKLTADLKAVWSVYRGAVS